MDAVGGGERRALSLSRSSPEQSRLPRKFGRRPPRAGVVKSASPPPVHGARVVMATPSAYTCI